MLFTPEALKGMPHDPGQSVVEFYPAIQPPLASIQQAFSGMDSAKGPDTTVFQSYFGDTKITGKKADFMILDDPHAGPNAKPAKAPKKDYGTVGVRFLKGGSLHKVYTYRVRKGANIHLGQELVAETETGDTVVVVVEIHKTPQDDGPYNYKFLTKKVAAL